MIGPRIGEDLAWKVEVLIETASASESRVDEMFDEKKGLESWLLYELTLLLS